MLASQGSLKKKTIHKPCAKIRFVIDPPEGLKVLKIKPKVPTLFVEVIQSHENRVLSEEWIPLPLQKLSNAEPKTPPAQEVVVVKASNNTASFDTQAIRDFMAKHSKKNRYMPQIFPTPGVRLGEKLTLRVITHCGSCELIFKPAGHVCINAIPFEFDLKITTPGSIKTGANLKCGAIYLSGNNIRNKHAFLAETVQIKAARKFINSGSLSIENSINITAGEELINGIGAILNSKTMEIKAARNLVNSGLLSGEDSVKITVGLELINGVGAVLNSKTIEIKAAKRLINSGVLSGKSAVTITAGKELINKVDAVLTSDRLLKIDEISQVTNEGRMSGKLLLLIRKVKYVINNAGILLGGTIHVDTPSAKSACSFVNRGNIAARSNFSFFGQGFSHEIGTLTSQENITVTAGDINLLAETTAAQNIRLEHLGGIWVVKDTVKAAKELCFSFVRGQTFKEERTTPGSLRYAVSIPDAFKHREDIKRPLVFMANQVAEGSIYIDTPDPVIINAATMKANQSLQINAHSLDLISSRLLAVSSIKLKAAESLRLGGRELWGGVLSFILLGEHITLQKPVIEAAILSHGPIEMEARCIKWDRLEMTVGGDLNLKGTGNLTNISSQVRVKGNAIWEIPTSHQLLTHSSGTTAYPMTPSATVIIEGKLSIGNHALNIFASSVSCQTFESTQPNSVTVNSFTPFSTGTETYQSGEHRRSHTFHSDTVTPLYSTRSKVVLGAPIQASFSVGSGLTVSVPNLEISGILSAISVEVNGIQQGLIGQFDARIRLAPMVPKPFKGQVPLLNYFELTALYEISPGGETVYKSVLPLRELAPRLPRMLLREDGTVGISPAHLRRLFPREKEEHLLTKVMLGEFGRGFLNQEANTPTSMMRYLEGNTIHYAQTAQKLVTTQNTGMHIQSTSKNNALRVSTTNFVGEALQLPEPCIVDKIETLVFEDGHSEAVLSSVALFPKHYDNKRLRDGAGCVFALGDITFSGVPGSELHIRGNIDAQGLITYQDFNRVSHTSNMAERYESIEHQTRQKNLFGKSKTETTIEQVVQYDRQPGNEIVGKGFRMRNVNHFHLKGAVANLGAAGVIIDAKAVVDEGIIQQQVEPRTKTRQKGLLGLGGTTTVSHRVSQKAVGSVIQSQGPVSINALYGQFDATQFKDSHGNEKQVELNIPELHYHELIRAIEAHDKAGAAALKEQARTAKRKKRQGTAWLLVSLPVSYYTGGLIGSYLESLMGVTLGAVVVSGGVVAEATAIQTAAIVGLSGMGAGVVGAAIQSQPLGKAAFNGAVLSLAGHYIANAPVLAKETQRVKDIARGIGAGSTSALLNHGNIVENAVIGGVSAGAASMSMPGSNKDLSLAGNVSKAMVETAVAVTLSGGTANNLAVNLASAAMGATIGQKMSDLGARNGQQLARRGRLIKGSFEPELLAMVTKEASRLLTQDGNYISEVEIRNAFESHPALQGSPRKIKSNLIKLGRYERGSKDPHAAFIQGLGKIFSTTVLALAGVGNAEASVLEIAQERDLQTFKSDDKKFFAGRFLPHNLSARKSIRIDVLPVSKQPKSALLARSEVTQDNVTWSQALDNQVKEAVRTFHRHGIKVSYESVVKIFKTHSDLKLSPKGIEDSLVQIGRLDDVKLGAGRSSQEIALTKGVQKFIYYNVHVFAKEARAQSSANAMSASQTHVSNKPLFFRGFGRRSDSTFYAKNTQEFGALDMLSGVVIASEARDINSSQNINTLTPAQQSIRERYPVIANLFDGAAQGQQVLNNFFHSANQRFPLVPATANEFSVALLGGATAARPIMKAARILYHAYNVSSPNVRVTGTRGHARNNFNISSRLKSSPSPFTPAFNETRSFSTKSVLDGELYPKNKLSMLINYLEKRGTYVYGTSGSPKFQVMRNGDLQIYLPENPTILQVKHELSHWLDFKRLGLEEYSRLSVYQREKMVLDRLKQNRIWKDLNQFEKDFSFNYVEEIKFGYKPGDNL